MYWLIQVGICCFITDLGLCGPVDEKSSDKTYGIISYVAPEVLWETNDVMKRTLNNQMFIVLVC